MPIGIGIGIGFQRARLRRPSVSWSSPSAGTSIDWGDTATFSVAITKGTYDIASATVQIGTAASFALSGSGSGGTWSASHVLTLPEVGASTTARVTVTDSRGNTATADRTITVVDPFVALSATHWDLTQNTTIVDASCNAVADWTQTGLTGWAGTTMVEDGSTGGHVIVGTSTVTAGPGQIVATITPGGRTWCKLSLGASAYAYFQLSGDGALGTNSGCTPTIVKVGSNYVCTVVAPAVAAGALPRLNAASGDGGISYAGTAGSTALTVVSIAVTQRRASQVAPRVTPAGAPMGALAQATAAKQPFLWDGSAWSQASGLRFAGAQQLARALAASAQPNSLTIVCNPVSTAVAAAAISGPSLHWHQIHQTGGNWYLSAGTAADTGHVVTTGLQILSASCNTTASYAYKNNAKSAAKNIGTFDWTDLYVGSENTTYFNGMITDVVRINGIALSDAAWLRLHKALAQLRSITLAA